MDPDFDTSDALLELRGVTDRKADQLAEEYPNLPTLSWATWHDKDYLQDEVQIRPGFLCDQLYDTDLYYSYHSVPGRVDRPDRDDSRGDRYTDLLETGDLFWFAASIEALAITAYAVDNI